MKLEIPDGIVLENKVKSFKECTLRLDHCNSLSSELIIFDLCSFIQEIKDVADI